MPIPLIVAGVGAAASIFGASKAAGAAKNAAQMQQQSVNQAQQFAQQAWQQQQQALSPYRQAGTAALNNLMTQYGSQTPQDFAARSAGFVNAARMNPYGQPFQQPQGGMSLAQLGGGMQQSGGGGMQERGPELGDGGSGLVMVQAPTGETMQLSQAQAQQAVAKGARILG